MERGTGERIGRGPTGIRRNEGRQTNGIRRTAQKGGIEIMIPII